MSALTTPAARQDRSGTVPAVSRPDALAQGHDRRWPSPPCPGDLSRRIAHRRAELRLSQLQVAARAGITPRYMEYLERYPARPSGAVLRRLAAALLTTPAMLLGADAQAPAGGRPAGGPAGQGGEPVTVKLAPGECLQLIAPGGVGRVAFTAGPGPVVLPVNFAMVENTIVIRTGNGTQIQAHACDQVAFEVDHLDEAMSQGWSVLVSGQAHPVRDPAELRHLREAAAVWPWPGGEHEAYVRIVPYRITGRRIEAQ
jgi:nitroimidazol reductase NimA-like FMN-containing flavoprotein (pyridoxamine 5'-phosphate oxidase superfamily)